MTEHHYVRKALEEVIRLADDKSLRLEEFTTKREAEIYEASRSCEETISDLEHYFTNLTKQLDKWKLNFTQEIQSNITDMHSEFASMVKGLQRGSEQLRQLRDSAAKALANGQLSNHDLVYQVHSCIFALNQDLDTLAEFVSGCIPLKFIGSLDFQNIQRSKLGTLEHLSDNLSSEILPSRLPKIKLGQLFHLEFRIAHKHCEAVRKFIAYTITKDDDQTQVCAYLQDQKNGTYTLSFPITVIVPHTVSVWYLGEHIRNSPYTIVFKVGPINPTATHRSNVSKDTQDGIAAGKSPGCGTGDDREKGKWSLQSEKVQNINRWPTNRTAGFDS